jgi:hypothetical protein
MKKYGDRLSEKVRRQIKWKSTKTNGEQEKETAE